MSRIAVVFACLVLLAGCTSPVAPGGETDTKPTSTDTQIADGSSPFSADYQINSIQNCGPTCKQVNISVEVTNTGDDEVRYPVVSMSVYVLDEKEDIWFWERENERKEIWSDSDYVDNISAGETVTFTKSFEVGVGEGIEIIYGGDCVVYGDVAVDYSDREWNKTKQFNIESDRCEN
ncbi:MULTISPECIES: hypothetical protein [Haloferax]|uniref:Uncharacterized protein n=2 Tax=Haloferax TaxID=2251 RepID=A0A6G1Z682_9EURY|nr:MULTISPECIES: hypothetical protein [Haloferax]KAB1185664.1 hypothetical protein Hfx1149_14605 [Haloferax sp. CBA1149]MRW81928.1 hypothetical protein [Haloferax marinisediminis]